ncbi:dUTP diphosphatase [Alphaproteobacteria bacterium]|nr:dUTP diphosphatase [Alphaproteobacteria bacterium]
MNTPLYIDIEILEHAKSLPIPEYQTMGSAGMDLYAALAQPLELSPFERCLIPTGLKIALPVGTEAQVRPRSGLALKFGVTVLNSPGTIDSDYRGEIKILLINLGTDSFRIEHGLRVAQLIIAPVQHAILMPKKNLDNTKRGDGGFGSTGQKSDS